LNQKPFESLGVAEKLVRALDELGFVSPTPIQAQAIPHVLKGKDLLGIAQTGTGKTAAFALPLLQRLEAPRTPGERRRAEPRRPRALILAPTRELALQIHGELAAFGRYAGLCLGCIFGGVGQVPQIRALAAGLDVLVATPGRLLDLASQGHADLSQVSVLVLDEADRLLDMGFIRDVRRIVNQTPRTRQTLLFSATMPREVAALADDILKDPARVDVSPEQVTVRDIEQRVVMVSNADKQRVLEKLLRDDDVTRAIVFTRTKHGANKVANKLEAAGIGAQAIHGNKSQNARQRALQSFREGESWVLVATDIAARGIDIDAVSHVVNYELPHEPESYVHRIGRTGRAGATGVAWSLVDPSERDRLRAVEKLIRFSPGKLAVGMAPSEPEAPMDERRNSRSGEGAGGSRPGTGAAARNSAEASGPGDRYASDRPRRRRQRRRPRAA
jgi:ATP-dependent RNA helicase RhlE